MTCYASHVTTLSETKDSRETRAKREGEERGRRERARPQRPLSGSSMTHSRRVRKGSLSLTNRVRDVCCLCVLNRGIHHHSRT